MTGRLEGRDVASLIGAVAVSFVLYISNIFTFFFTIPLLLLDKRYPKRFTDTACVAALVLILARTIWPFMGSLNQDLTWAFIMVNMFLPLSLILGAVVWVNSKRVERLFERVLLLILPSLVITLVCAALLSFGSSMREALMATYGDVISSMFSSLFHTGEEGGSEFFALVVMVAMATLALPLAVTNNLVATYIAEALKRAGDPAFDFQVMYFKVPGGFVYIFLALWTLVLFSLLFVSVPLGLTVLVFSLAIVSLVIYLLQGFAIVYYNIRARGSQMTSFKLAAWLFLIVLLLQGLNAILVLLLALVGVLENWVNLRKTQGVFK